MIIVREREDGKWRSLSRSDVEDVTEEVLLRGRLEGVFSWAKKRLDRGGYIRIEIEDKATLRVRRFRDAYVMSGSVRPSSASMFADPRTDAAKDEPKTASFVVVDGKKCKSGTSNIPKSIDGYFSWALGNLLDKASRAEVENPGLMRFRARRRDRRLAFVFLSVP